MNDNPQSPQGRLAHSANEILLLQCTSRVGRQQHYWFGASQHSAFVEGRSGSRTVLEHLDVAHQFFVRSAPDNGHCGCTVRTRRACPSGFCSLTAGIGLEKRWKLEGPQRSAVHDSAAQWTCLRQSRLQMQKLQRHRELRKLSQRRGQSTHSWIFFSSSGRRRRGSRQ
jgi:hypothetical protein